MSERFDVEAVLRDVLEVLRRHNIPVETVSLNVSLLDAAFDELVPQLKTYKAGTFHRPMVIDNVPVLFHAQRRYPFDGIVQVLEHEIRPPVEACAEAVQRDYPDLKIKFVSTSATRSPDQSNYLFLHSYRLGIDCQFSGDVHADYNRLDLSVWLQQGEATAYPQLHASVGWLVDEESGGDWGLVIAYDATRGFLDYAPHQVALLQRSLPSYFKNIRKEVARRLSGDLADPREQYVQKRDGNWYVGGSRVEVYSVIAAWQQGFSPEEVRNGFPHLSLPEIYGTILYSLEHKDEMDAFFQQVDAVAALRRAEVEAAHPEFYAMMRERIAQRRA